MRLRGTDVAKKLARLAPPLDAETERELIAIAFAGADAKLRTAAQKLVDRHVPGAKLIKSHDGRASRRAASGLLPGVDVEA
jgi:hypothetical protein